MAAVDAGTRGSGGSGRAGVAKRRLAPAPEGIQNHIVQEHQLGYIGCFNNVCELLDPATKQPVSVEEQRRLMATTANDMQEWCTGDNGIKDGKIVMYTTFNACCVEYNSGNKNSTSLALPPRCEELWKPDTGVYFAPRRDDANDA
jgi:hypothetical protein